MLTMDGLDWLLELQAVQLIAHCVLNTRLVNFVFSWFLGLDVFFDWLFCFSLGFLYLLCSFFLRLFNDLFFIFGRLDFLLGFELFSNLYLVLCFIILNIFLNRLLSLRSYLANSCFLMRYVVDLDLECVLLDWGILLHEVIQLLLGVRSSSVSGLFGIGSVLFCHLLLQSLLDWSLLLLKFFGFLVIRDVAAEAVVF